MNKRCHQTTQHPRHSPERASLLERVHTAFLEVSNEFNFKVMEPAPLEFFKILKSGRTIRDEMYGLSDRAGNELGLRFDLTVGMTRYACSKRDLRLPAKLSSFAGVWRYDEPQKDRSRWFYQADFEIFGRPSVESEAEAIEANSSLFKKLGIECVIKVGSRKVLERCMDRLSIDQPMRKDLLRLLDKSGGKSAEELLSPADPLYAPFGTLNRLAVGGEPSRVLAEMGEKEIESFEMPALLDELISRRLDNVEFDMRVVRGLDYYTGMVFEVFAKDGMDLALSGGGRFDALPSLFGRPELSGVGFAAGVDRIAERLKAEKERLLCWVVWMPEFYGYAVTILKILREAGLRADMQLRPSRISKQLKGASESGADWSVIIGKREKEGDFVTLRNMQEGTERKTMIEELVPTLRTRQALRCW